MKRLTILSLMMLLMFVLGVQALGSISLASGNTIVNENEAMTLKFTTDATSTETISFSSNVSQLVKVDNNNATWTHTLGFDSTSDNRQIDVLFSASNGTNTVTSVQTLTWNNVNRAPVASAGSDQTAELNKTVTLDGSGSSDPDGNTLTYNWAQLNGTAVSLANSNPTNGITTFLPTVKGTYSFRLTVNDGASSSTDDILITVTDPVRLEISDFDVKVGGDSDKDIEDEADGYRIKEEAEPGDKIEFDIELSNLYTDDEDIEIEDVSVEITIEDIDDGDELEEEADEQDIDADDNEDFSVEFEVPERVDEDDYDVIIEIEGRDENGVTHSITKRFVLEVNKENHDVRVNRAELRPSTVSCNRNTNLDVEIVNFGADEEEEIRITATNSDLDLDFEEFDDGDIELETGTDDDAEYSVSVPIDASDVNTGTYPIEIKVYRDETRLEDTKTATLVVSQCQQTQPTQPTRPTVTQPTPTQPEVVVVTPTQPTVTQPTPTQPSGQFPVVAVPESDFTQSTGYVVLLSVAGLVLIALIAAIIVLLVRKN